MTVSIDWSTRVISVPKADLILVQSVPVEIREMNLNWFRMQLKDIEDNADGIVNIDTHRHNTEVTLGGLTYARIIEIINGYTVTFEDGQYAVNLVGANSNVADVVNVNQVSVRSANSAGMVTSQDIVYGSYNGGVHVDTSSSYTGTIHPVGTPRMPVNNMPDALLIATYNGFDKFFIHGDIVVDSGGNYSNMTFIGDSPTKSIIDVSAVSNVIGCEFYECHVTGTLDGDILINRCLLTDLNYVYGYIEQCFLDEGTIVLGGGNQAVFLDCWTGEDISIIDMGGAGQALSLSGLNGRVKIINKTGTQVVTAFLNSGTIILDLDTVTNGTVMIEGVGELIDDDGNCIDSGTYDDLIVLNNTVNKHCITAAVWDETLTGSRHNLPTSAGRRLRTVSSPVIVEGTVVSSTESTVTLDDNAVQIEGAYDPGIISIVAGTGAGQSRLIYDYNGPTRVAIVDRSWRTNPDETSEYIICGHPGREHVNDGKAFDGSTNTIQLNVRASSIDDVYIGQIISIRAGTGQDQVRRVIAYNGTTKIATVDKDWDVIPDTTSVYVILSTGYNDYALQSDQIAEAVMEKPVDGLYTLEEATRLILSALVGKLSGAATTTVTIRDINDTKDRITATVDENGNRLAVIKDVS